MISKSISAFLFLFLLNSCAVKQKSISESDWYAFTKTSTERIVPTNVYEFSDGMVRMHGDNIGYLMTNKSYKNFELSLEFRWNMDEKYTKGVGKKNKE